MKALISLAAAGMLAAAGCTSQQVAEINYEGANLYGSGQYDEAIAKHQAALDLSYEDPDSHFYLGQAYEAKGDLDSARFHYETALESQPSHRRALAALSRLRASQGDKGGAIALMKQGTEMSKGKAFDYLMLAERYHQLGELEAAVAAYQKAIEADPKSATPVAQLGRFYRQTGDRDLAVEYLKKAFNVDPFEPNVATELGELGIVIEAPREQENQQQEEAATATK